MTRPPKGVLSWLVTLFAPGAAGPVEFQQRLTIDEALAKARELRDAHFSHITIYNVLNRVEITDLEALMGEREASDKPKS